MSLDYGYMKRPPKFLPQRLLGKALNYTIGQWSSALFYSLIETAKANGLEPYKYLKYLFDKFPFAKTTEDIFILLPMNIDKINL